MGVWIVVGVMGRADAVGWDLRWRYGGRGSMGVMLVSKSADGEGREREVVGFSEGAGGAEDFSKRGRWEEGKAEAAEWGIWAWACWGDDSGVVAVWDWEQRVGSEGGAVRG